MEKNQRCTHTSCWGSIVLTHCDSQVNVATANRRDNCCRSPSRNRTTDRREVRFLSSYAKIKFRVFNSLRSAHIGGLVCGMLVGMSYSSLDLQYDWQRRVIPLLSVCILIALFVAGAVEFYLFTTPPASSFCPL